MIFLISQPETGFPPSLNVTMDKATYKHDGLHYIAGLIMPPGSDGDLIQVFSQFDLGHF